MHRLGILGCGRVAQRHCEVYEKEIREAKVVAVCDPIEDLANRRADQLQCQAVYRLEDLLAIAEVDTVVILTESGNHYAHAKACLEAGKNVIVEKPPTLLPNQIHVLERIAKEKSKMYAVILQNRYNPAMRALKQAFEQNRFGKIVLATIRLRWCRYQDYYEDGWHGTWAMDGGVINQQAFHHVDALQWICGPVKKCVAMEANVLNKLEAEDTMVATLQFADGTLGAIEATTAARPRDFEASISIVGEKGTVVVGGIALNEIHTWDFIHAQPEDEDAVQKYSQEVPTGYGLSHGPLLQDTIDRLNKRSLEPPISGSDAIPAIQLVHGLYRSIEVNSWVEINESLVSQRLGGRNKEFN